MRKMSSTSSLCLRRSAPPSDPERRTWRNTADTERYSAKPSYEFQGMETMSGMMRIATMFVILIIGLMAGPAVSL